MYLTDTQSDHGQHRTPPDPRAGHRVLTQCSINQCLSLHLIAPHAAVRGERSMGVPALRCAAGKSSRARCFQSVALSTAPFFLYKCASFYFKGVCFQLQARCSFWVHRAPQLHPSAFRLEPVRSLAGCGSGSARTLRHTHMWPEPWRTVTRSLAARAQRPHCLPPLHRRFAAAPLRVGSC